MSKLFERIELYAFRAYLLISFLHGLYEQLRVHFQK